MHKRGRGKERGDRESDAGFALSAQSQTWDWNSGTVRSCLSHPGARLLFTLNCDLELNKLVAFWDFYKAQLFHQEEG